MLTWPSSALDAEYWIIDLNARTLERSAPGDIRLEIVKDRLAWRPNGASAPFVLDLADYFSNVLDS